MQNSKWKSTEVTRVVIVGGGIAGLAAAKTLEEEDWEDYILLEAQDKIGGRIDSIPWNDNWIECGALCLYGEKSELAKVCQYYQLLSNVVSQKGAGIYVRDDGIRMDERLIKDINDVVQSACNISENLEVGDSNTESNFGRALRSQLRKHFRIKSDPLTIRDMQEEIFDWYLRSLIIDNSCFTLDELSMKHLRNQESLGLEQFNFTTGYSSIIKFITQGLNPKNIRLNSPVEMIEWSQNMSINNSNQLIVKPVLITLADKRQIFADCVIVTCSLGYLKANHKQLFNPELPLHLSQGIESLGFGLLNKIYLDFGEPWWEPNSKGFQLIWSKNGQKVFTKQKFATWTRDLTGFEVVKNHKAVLQGWVGGRGAYIIEMLSERQIAEDCANLLRHFLKKGDIPLPKRLKRTQWHSNKYIRGAYSHIPVNCDANSVTPGTLTKPVWCTITHKGHDKCIPIIMLAGEATHEQYFSTTHGAFETGVKQAKTFLQYNIEKRI
ncbi:spermine oxidase-like [Athalia rosae]|uniref:spermine oxidase-like n=1 Tax=Athalia rosae TaxID=37344 RepID=UPI002033C0D0|nr:spermine oxidase-like [Athalia rosae]